MAPPRPRPATLTLTTTTTTTTANTATLRAARTARFRSSLIARGSSAAGTGETRCIRRLGVSSTTTSAAARAGAPCALPRVQARNLSWGGIDERRSQSAHFAEIMAHQSFPDSLPVPTDDGACDHLQSLRFPAVSLPIARSSPNSITISSLPGLTILFCYPRTAAPNETVPEAWNAIPGARGCTPQACSFRDSFSELKSLGVANVFGVSTQSSEYQKEVHERLGLPYELLSDARGELRRAMRLPTFEWGGEQLLKRVTMAVEDEVVVKVWYPVFPPDKATEEVVKWLTER